MPTKEECLSLEKKIEDSARDLHNHLRLAQETIKGVADKLNEHMIQFAVHEKSESARYDEYLSSQDKNTSAINSLVEQMRIQSTDTQGLIETWKTTTFIVRGIGWIRNAALWVCTTIVGLAGVYTLLNSSLLKGLF